MIWREETGDFRNYDDVYVAESKVVMTSGEGVVPDVQLLADRSVFAA